MEGKIIINTGYQYPQKKQINDIGQLLKYYKEVIDDRVIGWFYPLDIVLTFYFIKLLQIGAGDICELGVAWGKSAIGLSWCKNDEDKLHLYDSFQAEISPDDAKKMMKDYGNDVNVHWNVCDLTQLDPKNIKFRNIRYLHIDACHLHRAILNDLNNFSPLVDERGIISVDDYNDQEYPGINTAITQFCLSDKGKDWTIFAIGQNKAYLCRKSYLKTYKQSLVNFLSNTMSTHTLSLTEFLNNNVVMTGSRSPMSLEKINNILQNNLIIEYT